MKYDQDLASSITNFILKRSPWSDNFMNLMGKAIAVGGCLLVEYHSHIPNVHGTTKQSQCANEEWLLVIKK
jgi:hypothetical protein